MHRLDMAVREVEERSAQGKIARIYHEVRQSLRVSGVNLMFRTWATRPTLLGVLWEDLRPNVETRAFEEAADHMRAEAVAFAEGLGPLGVREAVPLGSSQAYQLRAALDLYHYINPKLLVLAQAVHLGLDGAMPGTPEPAGPGALAIERGVPAHMAAMEMVDARPADPQLARLLLDIRRTLALPAAANDYRTLALWPQYLETGWERLKPLVIDTRYRRAVVALDQTARSVAQSLPHPMTVTRARLRRLGQDPEGFAASLEDWVRVYSQLTLHAALWSLDWRPAEHLRQSPFPASPPRQSH